MEMVGFTRGRLDTYDTEELDTSPFSQGIRNLALPEEFSVPRFVLYNRTSDPAAHLQRFAQKMSVWGDKGHLNCKVFSSSLGDLPLKWFYALPEGLISIWQQLRNSFLEKLQA